MRKTKILYVIGQLAVGGAERQLTYLAAGLDRSRFEVLVCSLSSNAPFVALLEKEGVNTIVFPQVMKPDLTRPFKLYHLAKSYQPDIIHSYLFVANTWSRIVGTVFQIPTILSERNSEPQKPLWMKLINRILYPLGTCLIANSKSGAERVIREHEFSGNKVFVIPNGIPVEKYQRKVEIAQKLLKFQELGIEPHKRIIGIIGRLSIQKNHHLLFEAFKLLRNQIPDACLLCIGDGPLRKELEDKAIHLGIGDAVIFTGNRSDIPDLLAIMDVMVLSSQWEGMPNVILEAMAAGCPVVATEVGGVSELIVDGETGWLCKPDDKYDLADKINYVLCNPEQVKKVIYQAFEFVSTNFSVNKMVMETEKIYEKILSTQR